MKIRVFAAMRWISIFCILLSLGCWIVIILFGRAQLDLYLWLIFGIMIGLLPIGILLWDIMTMENIILFNEQGISRIRFGKVIRYFDWKEVKTISCTTEDMFSGWIYISNKIKTYDYLSITKMRLDKDIIYFHMSEQAKKALVKFVPIDISTQFIEQLQDKI